MYLEIYPDIIFILNFIIDFILLFLLKKINKKASNVKRMIGASTVGAFFSVMASIFLWMNPLIRFVILYIVAAGIMLTIAFGRMKKMDLVKQVIALYLITYFAGGFINSIYYHTDFREKILGPSNSLIPDHISGGFVIVVALCLVPIMYLILWFFRWYQSEGRETYDVELVYNDKSVHTKALMDTGNCLYDPIFKKPVMVVENTLLKELLTEEVFTELEKAKEYMEGCESDWELDFNKKHILRLRFIPYRSIGKSRGMMTGLLLDKVLIHTGKETICNEKVTAAICDNHLSTKEDYHVLLHKELI